MCPFYFVALAYAMAGTELGPRSATSILAVSQDRGSRVTVDIGVKACLTQSAQRLAIDAGLVWRMGHLWGKDSARRDPRGGSRATGIPTATDRTE